MIITFFPNDFIFLFHQSYTNLQIYIYIYINLVNGYLYLFILWYHKRDVVILVYWMRAKCHNCLHQRLLTVKCVYGRLSALRCKYKQRTLVKKSYSCAQNIAVITQWYSIINTIRTRANNLLIQKELQPRPHTKQFTTSCWQSILITNCCVVTTLTELSTICLRGFTQQDRWSLTCSRGLLGLCPVERSYPALLNGMQRPPLPSLSNISSPRSMSIL